MLTLRRSFRAALAAGFLLASSPVVLAQDNADKTEEARRLYNDARKAFKEERFKDAALGFEAASDIRPHAVALYTAAQAWELAGEKARAADAFARALATPKLNDSQAARARQRLKELEAGLGSVVVIGSGETRVRLDDYSEASVPARLHAEPGEHALHITREDGSTETRQVTVGAGETVEEDTDTRADETLTDVDEGEGKKAPLEEPKKQPVRVETEGAPFTRTLGFIGIGAGVAALGGGLLIGQSAKDAESTYKAAPTQETYDHAKGLESKTNLMLIAGGVLTAAGVALVVFSSDGSEESPPGASAELGVSPNGVWARGQF